MAITKQERIARLQRTLDSYLRQQRRDMELCHDISGWGWEEDYEQLSLRIKKIRLVIAELQGDI